VHEYGGGSYTVDRGRVVVSSQSDGRLWRMDPDPEGLAELAPLTPEGPWRYADLRFDPRAERLYAVRETHDAAAPDDAALVVNEIVALALDGSDGAGRVLVSGPDFVSSPRPSPDGATLAWVEWDHPRMPWDGSRLRFAPLLPDGTLGSAGTVVGGQRVSIVQPAWSPDGVLHAASDETGWWNLYAYPAGAAARSIAPMEAELGGTAWVFDISWYAFGPDGAILAVARSGGRDRLLRISGGTVTEVETPFTEFDGIRATGDAAVVIGAGPHDGAVLLRLRPASGQPAGVLARSIRALPDAAYLPVAEPITFPTTGGATAHALYFAPASAAFAAPEGELPPLIVIAHGGPTSSAWSALSLERAMFASRGIAVVDVDYRGSTGYGRPYRDALQGQWGIADVDDCVAAARHLVTRGDVDPKRMAIRGGSAGGYTALAALAFQPDVFAAGISLFGIADLALIHQDGHKFESRYDEGLLAPWPEGRAVFAERSPIHFLDSFKAPMLLFQGLDDKVVPPSQLDTMEAGFTAAGLPHVAVRFAGEGHGFRRADSQRTQLRTELGFLGRVFGFQPADGIDVLEVPGLSSAAGLG
jgi:dipeptidyl aminopeptidase/acylaminoacyl peptidase